MNVFQFAVAEGLLSDTNYGIYARVKECLAGRKQGNDTVEDVLIAITSNTPHLAELE